jgi:hypothetical protein
MLESILITTVFNNIPFFDPIGIDPASHQNKIQQKTMNNCHTEQVQNLALEGSPRVKTAGFFEGLRCSSYVKKQVSSEAIELVHAKNDNRGEQPSVIQRAFAWTEDIDETADELDIDSNHQPFIIQPAFAWTDLDEGAGELDFDSYHQPSVIQPAFAWTDIDESNADEVECSMSEDEVSVASFAFEQQGKTLSGSVSTTTTVTMNTYNTIESWESLNASPTSLSYDPAMDEEVAPETNSPPPLTIAVLSFKPKQQKQQKNTLKFPSLPSVRSMKQMRTLSVANYAY